MAECLNHKESRKYFAFYFYWAIQIDVKFLFMFVVIVGMVERDGHKRDLMGIVRHDLSNLILVRFSVDFLSLCGIWRRHH